MTTLSEAPRSLPTPRVGAPKEIEAQIFVAPQWKLVWWKFRKHKMAMLSGIILILIYLVALFADFLAPFDPSLTNSNYLYVPPQGIHFDFGEGKPGAYLYGVTSTVDPVALRREFKIDKSQVIPLRFWVKGWPYRLLGIFKTDVHLFGPADPAQPAYLLGADRLGRDLLSRMIMGTRISMSIGLVGVFFSLILGIFLGGISGYYGGSWDQLIQRTIDFLRSIPSIPLWMGLAAAMPLQWPAQRVYFAITVILSLIGWTSLARVVRGRFLSLREEDFVTAARLDGASQWRLIFRHMLPAFTSHIIASITLAIPGMILSETSLSFLGLGLREPVVSWGVLLQDAQDIRSIATAPWLLIPALAVVVSVLALNFLGDGLRDAADPYTR
ncbi:MAG TPA: ABC transporter permease [Anaerolineales bacterium]|nr:ABC transporter permease [Anaerolineales bacterium]